MSRIMHTAGRGLIAAGLLLASWLLVSPALATVFAFQQISASVPELFIDATISINGDFSDLPTIDSNSNPIDFGNLLAFDIITPVGHFTLSDFQPACGVPIGCIPGFPNWSISPTGIDFIDAAAASDFFIHGFGFGSTINVDTDNPFVSPPECFSSGVCAVTGNWIAATIPEPSSITLLVMGLAALCRARHRG